MAEHEEGVSVEFEMITEFDCDNKRPDKVQDGFWPSEDLDNAGYVEPARFAAEMAKAELRMDAWKNGKWWYMGVTAKAVIKVRQSGYCTFYELKSPGLWGIESDSDKGYIKSVFEDECEVLKHDLSLIGKHFLQAACELTSS